MTWSERISQKSMSFDNVLIYFQTSIWAIMAEAAPMDDDHMVEILSPIFPHLSNRVLQMSIQHPENRQEPLNRDFLLQRCIDDLLELRTLKQTRIDGTLPGEEGHGDPGLEGLNDSALFEQGRNGTHNHDNATSTGKKITHSVCE